MNGRRVRIIKADHRYEGREGVVLRASHRDYKVPGSDVRSTWWLVELDPLTPGEALTAFMPAPWLTLAVEEAAA